jgi:hypothetical protein
MMKRTQPLCPQPAAAATSALHTVLQRKCACGGFGGSGGECPECEKKRLLQRSTMVNAPGGAAPPAVYRTLRTPGSSLGAATRSLMESKFGHNFGDVRVHHDSLADESARAVHADAYTVGRKVVFAAGKYAPTTPAGRRLLAHELTHVVQQNTVNMPGSGHIEVGATGTRQEAEADRAEQAVASGATAPHPTSLKTRALQRQSTSEEERKKTEAAPPPPATAAGVSRPQLQLDPEIEAQMALLTGSLLNPAFVRASFLSLDLDSILGAPPPPWLTAPQLPAPRQLVPAGPGPGTPQPASMGDLVRGIMKVPTVDSALTSLQEQTKERARRDWSSLSTGGKVGVISTSVAIGGGTLAGILARPEARQFTLDLLQNRSLPTGVPGLDFQFNLTGPEHRIKFDLNIGQFLPRAWGFK